MSDNKHEDRTNIDVRVISTFYFLIKIPPTFSRTLGQFWTDLSHQEWIFLSHVIFISGNNRFSVGKYFRKRVQRRDPSKFAGIAFNSRLIGNFCFPIFTFRKFHNDHSLGSTVAHSANPIVPPFNYPPESKSHSSLFAHSFEWRDSFCGATRGWREAAVVEKETDICTCFPNPPPPPPPPWWKATRVVVHARVKREKRGEKPERRRRDIYIYI